MKHEHQLSAEEFVALDLSTVHCNTTTYARNADLQPGDVLTIKKMIGQFHSKSMKFDVLGYDCGEFKIRSRSSAAWNLELWTTCPQCNSYFDVLTSDDQFFTESNIQPIEHETDRSEDVEVFCPKCECDFKVDLTW